MAALLSKAGKDLTVTVLLDALQQTKDFELSMAKKFGASVSLSPLSRGVHLNDFASYKISSKRHHRHQLDLCSQSAPHSSRTWGYMYNTRTSVFFLLLLGLPRSYQALRAIADLLAPHRGSNTRASLDTNQSHSTVDDAEQTAIVVLPSSTELFYVYGQTLEGCATLSTGKPLFDLLGVFKKWLRVYAGEKTLASCQRGLFLLVSTEEVLLSQMRR